MENDFDSLGYGILTLISVYVGYYLLSDHSIEDFMIDLYDKIKSTNEVEMTCIFDRKNNMYMILERIIEGDVDDSFFDKFEKLYGLRIKNINIIHFTENYSYIFVDNKQQIKSDGTYTFQIVIYLDRMMV